MSEASFMPIATPPFASNPVKTRSDLAALLVSMLDALSKYTSKGGARVRIGWTGTHYDEAAAQLEGFSRPIWGLAALLATSNGGSFTYTDTQRFIDGFSHGTDPDHPEFWGYMRDKDQRMVECSALGFAIAVAGPKLWEPLDDESKKRFGEWIGVMNSKTMPDTNWLWFRVFANLGLLKVGSPNASRERMLADLDHLDTFYAGGGWSRDGPEIICQFDYYSSSFAIQFAQLVYAKIMGKEDLERAEKYKQRAKDFALDFVRYFDEHGRAIPFGRSMTYRFAQSSFWGALAFADVELPAPLTWGIVKGLQLRNIRYWSQTAPGAWNADGSLTIGYNYPNHNMTENYNSPGSPYWCCKSFVTLSLPETHPFWTAEEEELPLSLGGEGEMTKVLEYPLHIATRLGGHTYVLSSGQQCSYALKQSAAKYGKFAYSSAFGYSVPVGIGTLEEAAADSMLALCDYEQDDGEIWKCRRQTKDARIEWIDNVGDSKVPVLRSMWYPWPDVEVETWLVPPMPGGPTPAWHLRVHRLRTGRRIHSAEGGFAIYGQGSDGRALQSLTGDEGFVQGAKEYGLVDKASASCTSSKAGVSGVIALESAGVRSGKAVRPDANSNLLEPRTVLPTLLGVHEPGTGDVWLITGVFAIPSRVGEEGALKGWAKDWATTPAVPEGIKRLMQTPSSE